MNNVTKQTEVKGKIYGHIELLRKKGVDEWKLGRIEKDRQLLLTRLASNKRW